MRLGFDGEDVVRGGLVARLIERCSGEARAHPSVPGQRAQLLVDGSAQAPELLEELGALGFSVAATMPEYYLSGANRIVMELSIGGGV